MLESMSVSQWHEWKSWRAIRGPLGPDRWDFYIAYLAMRMGEPYPRGEAPDINDFRMPWQPEVFPADEDDE